MRQIAVVEALFQKGVHDDQFLFLLDLIGARQKDEGAPVRRRPAADFVLWTLQQFNRDVAGHLGH